MGRPLCFLLRCLAPLFIVLPLAGGACTAADEPAPAGAVRPHPPVDAVARIDAAFARLADGETPDTPDAVVLPVPALRRARPGFELFAGVLMLLQYWKAEQGGLFDRDYASQYALARDAVKYLSLIHPAFRDLGHYARFSEREGDAADLAAFRPFGEAMDLFLQNCFAAYGAGYRDAAPAERGLAHLHALLALGVPALVGTRAADGAPMDVRVCSGYDRGAGRLRLIDPADGAARWAPADAFLADWARAGRPWAALVAVRGAAERAPDAVADPAAGAPDTDADRTR